MKSNLALNTSFLLCLDHLKENLKIRLRRKDVTKRLVNKLRKKLLPFWNGRNLWLPLGTLNEVALPVPVTPLGVAAFPLRPRPALPASGNRPRSPLPLAGQVLPRLKKKPPTKPKRKKLLPEAQNPQLKGRVSTNKVKSKHPNLDNIVHNSSVLATNVRCICLRL